MRLTDLASLMEAAQGGGRKIDRSAFIYLEPKGSGRDFAQCKTCFMFMPGKERCGIFGRDDRVIADASCGLYVKGEPSDDQEIRGSVTPKAAGYVEGQVRCENCSWYVNGECELFAMLSQRMPDAFDLDPNVKAKGCCNAWQG